MVASEAGAIHAVLFDQRDRHIERGFYWENQIAFVFNSEKMEGNPLTKEQTRSIFETNTVSGRAIPNDNVTETKNHFRMFDFMLNTLDQPLTKKLMQDFHRILKTGTADDLDNSDFVVGGWKLIENGVGGIQTTAPADVDGEIERLLRAYDSKAGKTYRDIVGFHTFFERIYPFQDGNGRVGRVIMFRECLANDLVPFIVLDETKERYYQGLQVFNEQPNIFINYCEELVDQYLEAYSSLIPAKLLLPNFEKYLEHKPDYAKQAEQFLTTHDCEYER
ncbi:Fic family protein [Gordonibacter sp.]|uniref:Fic family protein n=1 Tax=Gordonibacter sp. TaxID=1968902 RepID=UPI002FCBCB48